MKNLPQQIALRKSLSEERFKPYLNETQKYFNNPAEANEHALELYSWAAELAGMFHTQIIYVEAATRNALSVQLSNWSSSRSHSKKWTRRNRDDIGRAIGLIKREKMRTYNPTHDDIIAKLTFSFWVNLIKDQNQPSDLYRQLLWKQSLNQAFPYSQDNDENGHLDLEKTRHLTADQLSSILTLRNRIAHHDNLLRVQYELLIHRIYAVLGRIGGEELTGSIDPAPLRAHIAADPRNSWGE